MKQTGWKLGMAAMMFSATFLVACQGQGQSQNRGLNQNQRNGPELPPRFSMEMYHECRIIKRMWEKDYVSLVKRRFANGQNVFLYRDSPLGSGPPLYGGLHDAEWRLPEAARAAIAKGGSWGVSFPDTGCPNIPVDFDEHYMEQYNRFALSLYATDN